MKFIRHLFLIPVYFYQKAISPLIPSRCRYTPTCSSFCVQAVLKHGVIKGFILTFFRILRCHSMFCSGHDEVPEKFNKKTIFTPYKTFYDKN